LHSFFNKKLNLLSFSNRKQYLLLYPPAILSNFSIKQTHTSPADMSGFREGWGGGFTDDALRPGKTDYGEWSVLSRDGKKILIAYPYEVVFKDGTKWQLQQE
jgi:hypothetical protein